MPARDGTGPMGQGSRTGRGMSKCNPKQQAVSRGSSSDVTHSSAWLGRFWGSTFGRAFRRGRRNRMIIR